jgi:MFS family permease
MIIAKATFDVIIVLSVILGLFYCYLGYKIFKIILGILGFAVGAALGGALAYSSSGGDGGSVLIAALLAGALGAALFVALYFVGTFLLGAGLGGLLGAVLSQASGSGSPSVELILILAVIGGILAIILQKFVIIVSTALVGSWAIVTGIYYFAEPRPYRTVALENLKDILPATAHLGLIVVLWILVGITGVVVQYRRAEKGKDKGPSTPFQDATPQKGIEGPGDRTTAAQIRRVDQKSGEPLEEEPVDGAFLIQESRPYPAQAGDADERPQKGSADPDEDEYNF